VNERQTNVIGAIALCFVFGMACVLMSRVKPDRFPAVAATGASSAIVANPPPPASPKLELDIKQCARLLSAASDGREFWIQRARDAERQLADLTEERASSKPVGAKR
jgi:hypothetical protein